MRTAEAEQAELRGRILNLEEENERLLGIEKQLQGIVRAQVAEINALTDSATEREMAAAEGKRLVAVVQEVSEILELPQSNTYKIGRIRVTVRRAAELSEGI